MKKTFIEYYPGEAVKEMMRVMKNFEWVNAPDEAYTEIERKIFACENLHAIRYFEYDGQPGDVVSGKFYVYEPNAEIKLADHILIKEEGVFKAMRYIRRSRYCERKIIVVPEPKTHPAVSKLLTLHRDNYILGRLLQEWETFTEIEG